MSEQVPPGPPSHGYQGGNPKAQAKAEKAYRKASRPFYKKKRWILGGLLVLLILVVVVPNSGGNKNSSTSTTAGGSPASQGVTSPADDAAKNVTVTNCKIDDLGGTKFATIGYTVNNPTSKSSTYFIAIDVTDSTKARVSEANGIEANVLPGRPSQGTASGNVSGSAVAPFTCTVGKVTRTAAN